MTPFEKGYITKMAGIFGSARRALKYLPTAAALGVAGGVGGELPFAAYNAITGDDKDYDFSREAAIAAAIGVPIAYFLRKDGLRLLRGLGPTARKTLGKPNSFKHVKNMSLFKGADPLIELAKGPKLWKPAAGAVAGAAINYDEDNKLESLGKGALAGATMASPFMFKGKDGHRGFAHKFVNEAIDAPALAVGLYNAPHIAKQTYSKAKSLYNRVTGNQEQPNRKLR